MIRHFLTLVVVAGVAAFVGGQQPKALTPQQRGLLFDKNRAVIERLVEKTVESSKVPGDDLKQADSYYRVLFEFNSAIRSAQSANEPARVDELSRHLTLLLDEGLTPALRRAKVQVAGGSGLADYQRVKDELLAQFNDLLAALSDKHAAKKSLDDAKARLEEITGPKK